ncbi:UNC5C-like protein [Mya arenaria]|uniref:UNC5C-like protein n=1 Tax=Mya arenaria TaxID=6604 RepID=A0ABY7DQ68_MYAAR|nr:UNC5C-like protein [Mya arenaria]
MDNIFKALTGRTDRRTMDRGRYIMTSKKDSSTRYPYRDAPKLLPIDGGWSQWSSWSNCSSTCGHGERTRYRMCDSPTPNFGGAFCQGESVQRRPCSNFCPDSIPYTPLHAPRVSIECACGCRMLGGQGEVVASGRCTGNSVWILSAPEGHVITLWFTFIDLYEGQWVKVRNGASSSADLLAFTDGRTKVERVSTSDHQMLVEFYSPPGEDGVSVYSQKATKPIHVHGFIANFYLNLESTAASVSPVVVAPVVSEAPPSIWESTVTIVGISLCGLVVVTAIIFVIYHRACHSRLHKYAMAAHEESPRRMCKSTSMRSTPSHESGNHGIEIEHDMETPLTGMPPNIDNKKRAKTPGGHSNRSKGSLASVHSHHAKTCKAEVEIDREFRRPSAIHSHRDYMQVPQDASPRRTPRNHELVQAGDHNNMSLFKTSPLVKTKVPRSPKIHPSPKLKSHIHSRTHSPCDNNQKSSVPLIPKRLDSLGSDPNQRVVMGSDYTPTNSVKSPPSDSSKHDCPTPTNINFNTLNKPHSHGGGTPTSHDIKLNQLNRLPDDSERNGASGKSDNSTNADNNVTSLATTSFIENSTKPRRPTSLTESYSKMSLASIHSKASVEGSKEKTSVTSSDDRQNILPKPDGQSPKSQRLDLIKVKSHPSSPSKTSKTSTPLSAKSLRSDRTDVSGTTKSPARSINTPSDVIELEYDDFIDMDDTYSYFDPVETEKLTWHGVERVKGNTPK